MGFSCSKHRHRLLPMQAKKIRVHEQRSKFTLPHDSNSGASRPCVTGGARVPASNSVNTFGRKVVVRQSSRWTHAHHSGLHELLLALHLNYAFFCEVSRNLHCRTRVFSLSCPFSWIERHFLLWLTCVSRKVRA